MKNAKRNLIVLLMVITAVTTALVLMGCDIYKSDTSTFTLSGAPSGNNIVAVYSSNKRPTTTIEFFNTRGDELAAGSSDTSKIELYWFDGAKSGTHLVAVTGSGQVRVGLVKFNKKGNGSAVWGVLSNLN